MATKILKSYKGTRMRLTRLDECGEPVVGDATTIVTDGFVRVQLSNEIETGDEYTQKNANGDFCVNEKDPDRIKWTNVTIELCEIDPDTIAVIGGDAITALESGDDVIGYTVGTGANFKSFGLEVWTKVPAAACEGGDPQHGYTVLPLVKNGRVDGDLTIENAVLTFSLTGQAFNDLGWGASPYTPNPLIATFTPGDLYGQVVTTIAPPAVTDGAVAFAP